MTALTRHGATSIDAVGQQGLGTAAAMRPDSIFRIASLSKPIAAAATMMLVEDGRLDLDEPVDRLLPELANRRVLRRLNGPIDDTVPSNRPIMVSDLLTLRMGTGAIMAAGNYPIVNAMIERMSRSIRYRRMRQARMRGMDRRLWHGGVLGPRDRVGPYPADPAHDGFAGASGSVCRLLVQGV